MKNKLWLYGALVLNIASAFNLHGQLYNILSGLHIAVSIYLFLRLFSINITINNNISNPKDTDKKEYEFKVIEYNQGYINARLQEKQEEGWEIAGNSNTYKGKYDDNTYVSIPLKRLKSNN